MVKVNENKSIKKEYESVLDENTKMSNIIMEME